MKPITISVVEDEEAHLELIKRSMDNALPRVSIQAFPDAISCLDSLQGSDPSMPDIVVVDYLTPGMNGIEFIEALRSEGIQIPVVVITGQGDEHVAVQALKLGASDYLVKSAGFFSLLPSVIRRVLREQELKDSAAGIARLNEMLMNSFPHPAMLIGQDLIVLAANRVAKEMGARVGDCCWRIFGDNCFSAGKSESSVESRLDRTPTTELKCNFCLDDQALGQGRPTHPVEVRNLGRIWDLSRVPVDDDIFLVYAIDVSERFEAENALRRERDLVKRAEESLQSSEGHLRLLSAQLLRAQEDERKRIAGELHDSFGSGLTAVKICLERLADGCRRDPSASETLEHVISLVNQLLEESRRIMNDLRPSILDDLGIVKTIGWFSREFRRIHPQIDVMEIIDMDEGDVPESCKIAIYRVIQESFHNIVKHSGAQSVDLRFQKAGESLLLTVEDNGIGFDARKVLLGDGHRRGLGLSTMKERTELSGGRMLIESAPGEGTRILAAWPVIDRNEDVAGGSRGEAAERLEVRVK
jgi:signal transduction histidine kinase